MGIPDYLTCLLRNLYAGQKATVRTVHGTTDWFQIGKRVCQGCMLSPCLYAGRDWGQEEKGTTEDGMAGWHHWLDARESEWTLGVGDGQGGLACCDSWGRKESDTTERLIWSDLMQSTSCEMQGWMKHKLESRLPGEINNLNYADDTILTQKVKKNWRASWWKWKRRVKKLA